MALLQRLGVNYVLESEGLVRIQPDATSVAGQGNGLPDKALGCRKPLQFGRSEHRGKQRRGLHGLRLSAVRPKQKEFHVPKSSGELAKHLGVVKDLLQTQRGELGSRAALLQTHRGVAYAGRGGGGGGRGGRGGGAGHQKRHVGFTGTQN